MRIARETLDRLATLGIFLRDTAGHPGRQYVRCPKCTVHAQHAYNRRARKLAVDTREGHLLWFCNNCGFGGRINEERDDHGLKSVVSQRYSNNLNWLVETSSSERRDCCESR